jgi:phage portal protein BeeE
MMISPATAKDAMGVIPLTEDEKDDYHKAFKAKYGITHGKLNHILTNIPLNAQPISLPIKDLMLMESIKESIRQIAESYDLPMMLLGFSEGTTFSNMAEAKKSLYQDAIIPESDDFCAAFTAHFDLAKQGMYYRAYFDHLEIFQRSRLNDAQALKAFNEAKAIEFTNGIITAQQWQQDILTFTT